MPHTKPLADRAELVAAVRKRVIGHEPAYADPVTPKPCERTPHERRHGGCLLVAEHFHVHEARGIVDGDVNLLPADAADTTASVARNAMTDPANPSEFLDVEVHQVSRIAPFVSHWRRGRLEG